MIGLLHDGANVRRMGGAASVDFEPDFDARVVGGSPALGERSADLRERAFRGYVAGQIVGAHLDAAAADIGDQLTKLAAGVDIPPNDLRIGRMKFADSAATPNLDARIPEAGAHLAALLGI